MTTAARNARNEARFDAWMDKPWSKSNDAKRLAKWAARMAKGAVDTHRVMSPAEHAAYLGSI